jgi:hypothetical protein
VAPGSPAEGKLGQGDILLKLGDQLLVNRDQLRALLRPKRTGDEVSFEILRGGRREVVKVKLAESLLRDFAPEFTPPDIPGFREGRAEELMKQLNERTKRLNARADLDTSVLDDALKDSSISIHGDDSASTMNADGVKLGVSVVTIRNIVRPEGKVILTKTNDRQTVLVKDKDGKTIAEGPLTDELRAKLPEWAREAMDVKPSEKKPEAKPAEGQS